MIDAKCSVSTKNISSTKSLPFAKSLLSAKSLTTTKSLTFTKKTYETQEYHQRWNHKTETLENEMQWLIRGSVGGGGAPEKRASPLSDKFLSFSCCFWEENWQNNQFAHLDRKLAAPSGNSGSATEIRLDLILQT